MTRGGAPFFWLGDTAWRLHRLPPGDLAYYLDTRKTQGYNVIQGPILTLDSPDYRGRRNDDPFHPNEEFFRHIDHVVDATNRRGMYSALVVTWGHHFRAFRDEAGARDYGRWLGARYRDRENVVWIVAGEYAIDSTGAFALSIWRALGEGLREGSEGRNLITVHGNWSPPALQTPSTFYHRDPWLDFNMVQTGQGGNNGAGAASWTLIEADYRKDPPKPVLDGEATYERVEAGEKPPWDGFGIRRRAYWSVFAGAFGHTYGANHVFYTEGPWRKALTWEGGSSLIHLRSLMESRPMRARIPDQRLLVRTHGGAGTAEPPCERLSVHSPCDVPFHVHATRDANGSYAMVYIPEGGRTVTIDASALSGHGLVAWWYDPGNGTSRRIGTFPRTGDLSFTTPAGTDWVLVLDDAAKNYPAPGRS